MSIKKFIIPSLTTGALLALISREIAHASTKSAPVEPAYSDPSYDGIDEYIEEHMCRLNIPGVALAIVEGDRIVHMRGFGRARPGGEPPSPQTPFFIGYTTKSFTALAVMQLVEAGKVELDTPIQRYLPWFRVADPQASAQITVRHLLNQNSSLSMLQGMAELDIFENSPGATERQVRALSTLQITHPVGTKFEYSNINYNILGLIIETASGESYSEYVQNHIFTPLAMEHSYTSKPVAQRNGLAMGHRFWFGIPIPAHNLPIPNGSLPSGQLISCAEDMAQYLMAYLNDGRFGDAQILSSPGIAEMLHGVSKITEMGLSLGSYAMGWIDQGSGTSRIVSHTGAVPDFGAFMALMPEQKKGIVLLYNANNAIVKMSLDEFGSGAAQRLAGILPAPTYFGAAPWLMRGLLLVPLIQIASVASTLRLSRSWRLDPALRPNPRRLWGQHIFLPLIPNLLPALTLIPMLGKMRGFLKIFSPDFSWIALICGAFAGIWTFLRPALLLRYLRKSS